MYTTEDKVSLVDIPITSPASVVKSIFSALSPATFSKSILGLSPAGGAGASQPLVGSEAAELESGPAEGSSGVDRSLRKSLLGTESGGINRTFSGSGLDSAALLSGVGVGRDKEEYQHSDGGGGARHHPQGSASPASSSASNSAAQQQVKRYVYTQSDREEDERYIAAESIYSVRAQSSLARQNHFALQQQQQQQYRDRGRSNSSRSHSHSTSAFSRVTSTAQPSKRRVTEVTVSDQEGNEYEYQDLAGDSSSSGGGIGGGSGGDLSHPLSSHKKFGSARDATGLAGGGGGVIAAAAHLGQPRAVAVDGYAQRRSSSSSSASTSSSSSSLSYAGRMGNHSAVGSVSRGGVTQLSSYVPPRTWVILARVLLIAAYLGVLVNAVLTCYALVSIEPEAHVFAWAIAEIFVSIAVPLSLHDIQMHMLHYVNPLQRYYIRILFMVPIYAVESWLALRFTAQRVYLETAREAYEAFVVYSFYKLMTEFLGNRRMIIAKLQEGTFESSGLEAIEGGVGGGILGRLGGAGAGTGGDGSRTGGSKAGHQHHDTGDDEYGDDGSANYAAKARQYGVSTGGSASGRHKKAGSSGSGSGGIRSPSHASRMQQHASSSSAALRSPGHLEGGDVLTYQLAAADEEDADADDADNGGGGGRGIGIEVDDDGADGRYQQHHGGGNDDDVVESDIGSGLEASPSSPRGGDDSSGSGNSQHQDGGSGSGGSGIDSYDSAGRHIGRQQQHQQHARQKQARGHAAVTIKNHQQHQHHQQHLTGENKAELHLARSNRLTNHEPTQHHVLGSGIDVSDNKVIATKRGGCCGVFGRLLALACGMPTSRSRDGYATMLPPFCCMSRWRLGAPFLIRTSFGVLQYVVVRTVLAIVMLALEGIGKYNDGSFADLTSGYVYSVVILNISQGWALWCLALFAYHLWEHLGPIHPLGKFVVVKWIVFVSWWQGVVISGLVSMNIITGTLSYDAGEVAAGLQDFLICIEMCIAAWAHHAHFPYADFRRPDMTSALAENMAAAAAQEGMMLEQMAVNNNPHVVVGIGRSGGGGGAAASPAAVLTTTMAAGSPQKGRASQHSPTGQRVELAAMRSPSPASPASQSPPSKRPSPANQRRLKPLSAIGENTVADGAAGDEEDGTYGYDYDDGTGVDGEGYDGPGGDYADHYGHGDERGDGGGDGTQLLGSSRSHTPIDGGALDGSSAAGADHHHHHHHHHGHGHHHGRKQRTVKQLRVHDDGRVTVINNNINGQGGMLGGGGGGSRPPKAGVSAALADLLPVDVVADTAEHLAAASAAAGRIVKRASSKVGRVVSTTASVARGLPGQIASAAGLGARGRGGSGGPPSATSASSAASAAASGTGSTAGAAGSGGSADGGSGYVAPSLGGAGGDGGGDQDAARSVSSSTSASTANAGSSRRPMTVSGLFSSNSSRKMNTGARDRGNSGFAVSSVSSSTSASATAVSSGGPRINGRGSA